MVRECLTEWQCESDYPESKVRALYFRVFGCCVQCWDVSVPQTWVIGVVAECVDVERWASFRNLPPESAQPRVVDAPGPEKIAIWSFYELKRVARDYAHRIKDVGRESDLRGITGVKA